MENGLPSDNCFKSIQAADGTIWVATLHGIARYNGYRWIHFSQEQKNKQLPSNWVMDLCSYGNSIWFHTDRGSGSISTQTLNVKVPKNKHLGWGKLFSKKDEMYISSWKGIYCYSLKNPYSIQLIPQSENKSFHQFKVKNDICYGLADDIAGYFEIKAKKLIHRTLINQNNQPQSIELRAIFIENNSILACTKSNGIIRIDPTTRKFTPLIYTEDLVKSQMSCINRIQLYGTTYYLIGTEGNGVFIYNKYFQKVGHWLPQSETPTTSLQSSIIQDISIDQKNGIWISTEKGISYFHLNIQKFKSFFFYRNTVIPENTTINTIVSISKNDYLIGTEKDGLFYYSSSINAAKKINLPKSFTTDGIICIRQIGTDLYCVASRKICGILNVKTTQFKELSIQTGSIFGVAKVTNESIAIAASTGVCIYSLTEKKVVFQELKYAKQFYSEQITKDVFVDDEGNIWALRFFNGLIKIHPKTNRIERFSSPSLISLGTDFHNLCFSKSSNALYVSSSAGIFIHPLQSPKKYTWINSKNGLTGDFVDRCLIDPSTNQSYYSTPTGIYQYNEQTHSSYLLHQIQGYRQKWFNDFYLTPEKELIVTVSNYFAKHTLSRAIYSTPNAPIIESISNIKTGGDKNEIAELNSKQNTLHFSFLNTNYSENEEIELEYAIDTKNSWTKISLGQLDLIDLSSGNYCIKFRNRNLSTGIISKETTFSFSIAQPFYFKWWFIALNLLLITAVIYFIFYIRLKNKEQLMETRMQLSRDLHDELGANVSSIQIMASMLHANADQNNPNLPFIQNIKTYSKEISETINDIIWNVNPKFDTLEELSLRMKRYANTTLEAAGIQCDFEIDALHEGQHINQTAKYHIYLIFKEIINNCAKYSAAKNAQITLKYEGSKYFFTFKDNGIGFDLDEAILKGNGLKNIQNRADKIDAKVSIIAEHGKGTYIQLILTL